MQLKSFHARMVTIAAYSDCQRDYHNIATTPTCMPCLACEKDNPAPLSLEKNHLEKRKCAEELEGIREQTNEPERKNHQSRCKLLLSTLFAVTLLTLLTNRGLWHMALYWTGHTDPTPDIIIIEQITNTAPYRVAFNVLSLPALGFSMASNTVFAIHYKAAYKILLPIELLLALCLTVWMVWERVPVLELGFMHWEAVAVQSCWWSIANAALLTLLGDGPRGIFGYLRGMARLMGIQKRSGGKGSEGCLDHV